MAELARVAGRLAAPLPAPRSRTRRVIGDVFAGGISGLIVLSYCLSYSSLLFPGALAVERPSGLWALLIGSIIVGLVVSWRTSLPPIVAAPDTAGVAVLAGLGASVASRIAADGGTPAEAATHMLLCFSLAGGLAGMIMLALGATGTASYIRFIPYPVAAGFIGATGLLMIINSVRVILPSHGISWSDVSVTMPSAPVAAQLAVSGITALLCILARWWVRSSLGVPVIFLTVTLAANSWLSTAGEALRPAAWFTRAVEPAVPWNAMVAVMEGRIDWTVLAASLPEIVAFSGVLIMSALIKTTNIEVWRAASADLDREFTATGWANMVGAVCGGVGGVTQTTPSRALVEAGGTTRFAGMVSAMAVGAALFTSVDLTALVPVPVLSGLLIYFGWTSLMDMLGRPSAHLSWLDVALILIIIAVCAQFGFETGGLIGFVLSCIIFVFRYRAIGVVRRHMTRRAMASILSRPAAEEQELRRRGDAIHVYWLSGYLFFGSSDSLYERIRDDVEGQTAEPVRFIVLDFAGVAGLDISALKSLTKLTTYCDRRRIEIAYTGLSERYRRVLSAGRFIGQGTAVAFDTRSDAMEWAENRLLAMQAATTGRAADLTFDAWLREELSDGGAAIVLGYMERRVCEAGTRLYAQGEDADTIEFVASGVVAITVAGPDGTKTRVRRMARQTIVGEMGFFRRGRRTANVEIEQDSVLYTMSRAAFERMRQERPEAVVSLLAFVIRVMADRLEFANTEIAAMA
jgi:SulP family sulfate permease